MITSFAWRRARFARLAFALSAFASLAAFAQQVTSVVEPARRGVAAATPSTAEVRAAAAAGSSSSTPSTDAPLVLSPFEVSPDDDSGYQATSTLAGTRLRSDLKDLAASISVITKDFMDDVNASDLTSLLVYTLGTEVGGYGGNFSDLSNPEAQGVFDDALGQASPGTRVRGLIGADRTRNYFQTDVPLDTYNNERVEINRGANANLFGLGSPSGIINSGLISADLRRSKTTVTAAYGSYGSYRSTLDHSLPLFRDHLSLRLATMFDNTRYAVEDAFVKKKGITLTTTAQPFANTKIRASTEWGRTDSNKPEIRPPYDRFSWWWAAGQPVWNPVTNSGRLLGTPQAPFTATTVLNASGARQGAGYFTGNWDGLTPNLPSIFYLDPHSSVIGGLDIGGGVKVDGVKGFADNAILPPGANALVAGGMIGLNSWTVVNQNVYHAGDPLRTLYNREPMVTDPRVFDYFHHMLGGPTKYEFAEWTTQNVTLEHTFLERRAGVEVSYDRQRMDNGFTSPMRYTINLDVNERLPNGAPNPNFLRPVTLGSGFKRIYSEDRDAWRATGYYGFDFRKGSPGWLAAVLGRHRLQGTWTSNHKFHELLGGTLWSNSLDWRASESQSGPGTASSTARIVATVHYLGDSVAGASGPGDVRLQALTAGQDPSGVPKMTLLYNKRPLSTAPSAQTPWAPATFDLLSNGREDVAATVRSAARYADRTEQTVRSTSFALQDHWFNGAIVTTGGWRRDQVWSYDAGLAPTTSLGTAELDWDVWYPKLTRAVWAKKTNWGVVGHLPRFITKRLPGETEGSVFYNSASNFRVADQRYTITGEALPSETGQTKEYGIRFSTFHGKLDFKVSRFETIADKATVGGLIGGLNQLASMVGAVIDHNYAGDNVNNQAGIAAFEAWLAGPYGDIYKNAFSANLIPNNDPGRPAALYGSFADATGNRGQISAVSALKSTGIEFETTFNPLRNWRISANIGSADAVRTHIAPELYDFLFNPTKGVMGLIQNPDGTASAAGRLIGAPTGSTTLQNFIVGNVINNGVITTFAQEGTKSDELRKWNFRAITNYTYTGELFGGRLRGASVGGAVRWADKPVLGYGGKVITSGGAQLVVADVTKPYLGPNDPTFDLWFGYGRRIGKRITWKAQLNLKNVGIGNELIPIGVHPDGSIVTWRIKEPQRWTLTNTFSF